MNRNSGDAPYDVEPGLCVIINNMDFTRGASLPGGKKDEEKLLLQFTALGFVVRIHRNLTGKEILDTVESYSTRHHSGAFFLAILSHGTSVNNIPAVSGTDGTLVEVNNLERFFYASNCRSLHGKPKIFLIDACRGSQRERTFNPVSASGMTTRNSSASLRCLRRPHSIATGSDSADFLTIHAATNGHVAFTTDEGSYLTQTFVKVVTKADETDSLSDIVTRVRNKVQGRNAQQTVEAIDRLTRKYLIKSNTLMVTIQELQAKFDAQIRQWILVRGITIEEIEKTIRKLKEYHWNNSCIARFSTSIACSLITIGLGPRPVILGTAIVLSVALAIAGGTAVSADAFFQKCNIKHVQDQLDRDNKQLDTLSQTAREIKQKVDHARQKCPGVNDRDFADVFGEVFTHGVARTTNVALRVAELMVYNTLEKGALALRVRGAVARGTAIAETPTLAEIIRVRSSINESQTETIEQLTDTVKQLKEQKAAIEGLIDI